MIKNDQVPTKIDIREDGHVWLHSLFPTIQGEGPFAGTPAVFVRLAGCNLQCPLCDTEYTKGALLTHPAQIVDSVRAVSPGGRLPLVVITGGEPFRQNLLHVCSMLIDAGYRVQIETNGTLFQPLPFSSWLVVVCSPKTGSVNKHLAPYIASLKYVARAEDLVHSPDGLPVAALKHTASPMLARPPADFDGTVYLQPADEQDTWKNTQNLIAVQNSCMKYGHTLCLQLHKMIGAP